MPEYRGTVECGHAEPFNFLWVFGLFRRHTAPDAAKFEGKWFKGEEPEGMDAAILAALEKKKEDNAEQEAALGYKYDNVNQMKFRVWSAEMQAVQPKSGPSFSDWRVGSFVYGYNIRSQTHHRWEQLAHCVGQLGEDHPTCQKAAWYYHCDVAPPLAAQYEEWDELGHWDTVRKWGTKPRRSFLPRYQPVKKNIPGAYEFFRSEEYVAAYSPDGSGEMRYPLVLPD